MSANANNTNDESAAKESYSWITFGSVAVVFFFLRGCAGGGSEDPNIRFYNTMVESNQAFSSSNPQSTSQAIAAVTRFAQVVTKYDKTDLSEDFSNWARRYESTLYGTRDTLQLIERQNSGTHLTQVAVEAMFRGYMGDPFGKAREENQAANQLQWKLQQRLNELERLNVELDGLRGKHSG